MSDFESKFRNYTGSLKMDRSISQDHKRTLRQRVMERYDRRDNKSGKGLWTSGRIITAAAAVILIAAVITAGVVFTNQDIDTQVQISKTPPEQEKQKAVQAQPAPGKQTKAVAVSEPQTPSELKLVRQCVLNKDIEGLIKALDSDDLAARMLAEEALALLGNTDTLNSLKDKAANWNGDGENPYTASMMALAAKAGAPAEPNEPGGEVEKAAVPGPGPKPAVHGLHVYVYDKDTGQVISGCDIKTYEVYNPGKKRNRRRTLKTDEQGYVLVDFKQGREIEYLSIFAQTPAKVPLHRTFRVKEAGETLPKEFVFELEPGTKVGGYIVNTDNEPVSNAAVIVSYYGDQAETGLQKRVDDYKVFSDEEGFWYCDVMPDDMDQFGVTVKHPDYADYTEKMWINRNRSYRTNLLIKDFTDLTAVLVMENGIDVTGYVYSVHGFPIKDAQVNQCEDRYRQCPKTKTDSHGRFVFKNSEPGPMILTVIAEGHAPQMVDIDVSHGMDELRFTLENGYTIKGRVVDLAGNPLQGAHVCPDEWRKRRTIGKRLFTDAQGYFEWNQAPADTVKFDIFKQGYRDQRGLELVASNEVYEIVLDRPLVITGNVIDAETKEPIAKFEVVPGIEWENNNNTHWQHEHDTKHFADGNYRVEFTYPYPFRLLRIEAEGYVPAISRRFTMDEGEVVANFELEKGTGKGAIVYQPDGTPAEGAEVFVIRKGSWAHFTNNEHTNKRDQIYYTTNAEGKFIIPPEPEDYLYKLVAVHETGIGEIYKEQFEQDNTIRLTPWARVEGQLYVGSEPGANETIHIYDPQSHNNRDEINCYFGYEIATDDEGKFIIEKIRPGDLTFMKRTRASNGRSTANSYRKEVEIKPGETVEVVLGGVGRPVIGRIVPPVGVNVTAWHAAHVNISSAANVKAAPDMSDLPKPANIEAMTIAEIMQWYQNWAQSDEGRQYQEKIRQKYGNDINRHYSAAVENDGTFFAEGVEEGKYKMNVKLLALGEHDNPDYSQVLGEATIEFEVPKMPNGCSDDPLDIGVVQLEKQLKLEPGMPVPDLTFEYENGAKSSLAQKRGKYVVLVHDSVYGQPGQSSTTQLYRDLQDAFAGNENLEMVHMMLTQSSNPLMEILIPKYIEENGIDWPVAMIETMDHETMRKWQYMRDKTYIIDPQGRLVVSGLERQELFDKVASLVAK